ncbi:MAG: pyridoxamine 5'-phosphate oxidase family protein [Acidimicrobiales bacterium]
MGKTYDGISQRLAEFLERQPVFFVATAPLDGAGHVNCSPKGNDGCFAVVDEHTVAYQDLTGSGIETVAHLKENGRIVVMFCAFSGPPRIVRLHGRGEVVAAGHPAAAALSTRFPERAGTRAVIRVDVDRVSDSCGYGVPLMDFVGHRDNLDHWAAQRGDDGLEAYRAEKNARSLDGLPGLA